MYGPSGQAQLCLAPPLTATAVQLNRRHLQISELGRFLHGCIINAIASTTAQAPTATQPSRRYHTFSRYLAWNNTCALCGKRLHLLLEPPRRVFSIGIYDIRVGNFLVRAEVSQNRADIYECFYEYTAKTPFIDISPIFFFYFAEIYHVECKILRGRGRQNYNLALSSWQSRNN